MPSWNESAWFIMFAGVALKSTVVLSVTWLAAFLMRRQSAAARHLLWSGAAVAVLLLPLLSILLPSLPVRADRILPANFLFQTTADAAPVAQHGNTTAPSAAATQTEPAIAMPNWRVSVMTIWAAGALLALVQMLAALVWTWRIRRVATRIPDHSVSQSLARQLGIQSDVDVFETEAGSMPMTLGLLRPAVLLPRDAGEWTEERCRLVLLHELAHVRRADNATQILARLALIINWWNPLAWIAWNEFLKERERAADDVVLQAGARASEYASHLLEIACSMRPLNGLGWAAVTIARRSQLEGRLSAILDTNVNRNRMGRSAALVAIAAAIAVIAPVAAVRAQQPAPESQLTFRTNQQRDAESVQRALINANGADGFQLLKIADGEKQQNHHPEAQALYTRAVQMIGDKAEAIPALIYLGVSQSDLDKALEYFQRAQRIDPVKSAPALMWMALVRERQQNAVEAESLYRSALAVLDPASADNAAAMTLFARFLNSQNREAESADLSNRVTKVRDLLQIRTAAQTSSSDALKIGGDVKAPQLTYKVEPPYSQEARFAKHQGTVKVFVEINPDGTAQNMRVLTGQGFGLDENALQAISQWRFKPGMKDGLPVKVAATIEVNFRLM